MNINHYTYRVTWSSDDKEHVGLCAEFPSLSWLAPSPEKALSGIRKVVADVVEEMTASGESVPLWFNEPSQPKPPNKVCALTDWCLLSWRFDQQLNAHHLYALQYPLPHAICE